MRLTRLINETSQDFDDDELDSTLSQTTIQQNGKIVEASSNSTNGNSVHNNSNLSSLSSSTSSNNKESPSY